MVHTGLQFNNHYARLPTHFYSKIAIEKNHLESSLIHFNPLGSELIGLDDCHFANPEVIQAFSGKIPLAGSDPLAMVYSGHQFGVWAGQLGDGRALLLGQIEHDNQSWDIQLKGSGLTPYSRMGDGRALMRSSIREYLGAEAMHALGIPSTRSLCLLDTHQTVYRESKGAAGAILVRLAHNHIRFGHFEHFYYNRLWDDVKRLADYTIALYFTAQGQAKPTYEQWFFAVMQRCAYTVAKWMAVGFCHGVMNTDNMSITGLTIDYGPYSFLEKFDFGYVCNSSDENGRYAYNQQPGVALWNLHALAHALQPILSRQQSQSILAQYDHTLTQHYDDLMAKKIGFHQASPITKALSDRLLALLQQTHADYPMVFNHLPKALSNSDAWCALFDASTRTQAEAKQWLMALKKAHGIDDLSEEATSNHIHQLQHIIATTNPCIVLRNWVAEVTIRAAEDEGDFSLIDEVLQCVQNPFTNTSKTAYPYGGSAPSQFQHCQLSCST